MVVELYPHQQKAVNQLHNGSILWGGVGTGKTLTALVYYYERVCQGVLGDFSSMRSPVDLYVITTAKKRDSLDWQEDAARLVISRDRDASVGGVRMVVDSWNNIGRYVDVENAFFIFDEQRLVGSGAWTKAFIRIAKRNSWILLSATPGDTWLDYIPVFVANGFYKNRTEFKRRHVVYNHYSKFPKVDHYVDVGHLVRLRNRLLVEMPYVRHTVRKFKDVVVDYDRDLFERVVKKRWHVYENRPLRDVAELFSVMRKVVNSDSSRLMAIQDLLNTHPRLIVFYNFDYELDMLRTLGDGPTSKTNVSSSKQPLDTRSKIGSGIGSSTTQRVNDSSGSTDGTAGFSVIRSTQTGSAQKADGNTIVRSTRDDSSDCETSTSSALTVAEWNGHKHQPIPKTDRWVYLVQYQAGAEGWNCIETDAMVFYSLTYSYKNFHQAQGRIDRLNTPYSKLNYYVLKSRSLIDKAVWKALSGKKNFNETAFSATF